MGWEWGKERRGSGQREQPWLGLKTGGHGREVAAREAI